MADKEATVYIVDTHSSMSHSHNGRTDFDGVAQYLFPTICSKIETNRKTLLQSVIAVGTQETNHFLQQSPFYDHISVLLPLQQFLTPHARMLKDTLRPGPFANDGDMFSAIILATDMILRHCRNLKYIKTIIVLTNGASETNFKDMDGVAEKLKELSIRLKIIIVDDDDDDDDDEHEQRKSNIASYNQLTSQLDHHGITLTLDKALKSLDWDNLRQVRSVKSFDGNLTIGRSDLDFISIAIQRFPCVRRAKPASATTCTRKIGGDQEEEEGEEEERNPDPLDRYKIQSGLQPVNFIRSYTVAEDDGNDDDNVKEVEVTDLDKGYLYGRTLVPMSRQDIEETMLLQEPQAFEIIGFIPVNQFDRVYLMGETNYIFANNKSYRASLALSSLIHGLYESDSIAIARLVVSSSPKMVALSPFFDVGVEGLVECQIPFDDDVRQIWFPKLSLKSNSGNAMDEYVDFMTTDAQPVFPSQLTNPLISRLHHIIFSKALDSTQEEKGFQPPRDASPSFKNEEDLFLGHVDRLASEFTVTKVDVGNKRRTTNEQGGSTDNEDNKASQPDILSLLEEPSSKRRKSKQ